MCYKKWSFHVYSDGWRHFLVCISSASERKETWINVHPLLGHPVSENFVRWCQTLKNSSASFLCIQETYFISTISQFESDSKMCRPLHFQTSTLTFVRLSGTSENWRPTSRSCITVVRRDKWKNQRFPNVLVRRTHLFPLV